MTAEDPRVSLPAQPGLRADREVTMARKAIIKKQSRLFDDFFKIDEIIVSHEQIDGSMSADQRRLVFERGDSVAVLLLNRDRKAVVLVEQFKVPSLLGRQRDDPKAVDGWILETVAGMIDENETPEAAVIREAREETGYQIRNPKLISQFFSSPGGTSERIFLYFAEVRDSDLVAKGGGLDDEDVKVVQMSLDDLFDRLANRALEDPKLLVAAYWLQDQLKSSADRKLLIDVFWDRSKTSAPQTSAMTASPAPSVRGPLPFSTVRYELKNKKGLFVGYKTGPIDGVNGVSLWVNSENTDMMMDRFLGRSISARIRFLGANKDENDNVIEDTIEEALRSAVGGRAHVKIGTVLVTESGQLLATHQVKRLFHVATVEGGVAGAGVKADRTKLAYCVNKLLKRADQENNRWWRTLLRTLAAYVEHLFKGGDKDKDRAWRTLWGMGSFESILIPMFGAGDGGLAVEDVARTIIPSSIAYLQHDDMPTLKEIYFLAYTERDRSACDIVLKEYAREGVLIRTGQE
jgi:nudix-type nucleoside diphosphatase (YffH/AdpP family)